MTLGPDHCNAAGPWYVIYLFFHPRDWTDFFFDTEHENDAEGVMLTVHRDGSTYGVLQSAVTVAHSDFFAFTPPGSGWSSGSESINGTLQMVRHEGVLRRVTAQEAKGRGLKARPYYDIKGDGVIYYPSLTTAEVPTHPDDRSVLYKLVDIVAPDGLWAQRNNTALFAGTGSFAGDRSGCGAGAIGCSSNAANAPWGWDDSNDRPARGALATDPAGLQPVARVSHPNLVRMVPRAAGGYSSALDGAQPLSHFSGSSAPYRSFELEHAIRILLDVLNGLAVLHDLLSVAPTCSASVLCCGRPWRRAVYFRSLRRRWCCPTGERNRAPAHRANRR
jgi:hypothetical protein